MVRRIGLLGVTANVVGVVIGIAIFILPGQLAVSTGPAVVVSYLLAGVMAGFACIVVAQIGAVFPVSGASFVAVSRMLSPAWAFIVVWLMIWAVSLGIALLAIGFADYLTYFAPGVDRQSVALAMVLGLAAVNLVGMRNSVALQVVLVLAVVIALTVFSLSGLAHLDIENFRPFAPFGLQPILLATIPAFFSFAGFAVVIELSGDIKNPARTLPWAFAIGFAVVLFLYVSVATAVVGIIPWQDLAGVNAPVGEAAARILPSAVVNIIVAVALAGAASTVNALLLSYSRDVMILGQSHVFPEFLGRTSSQSSEPRNGILFVTALATVMILYGGSITAIATLSTLSILVMQIGLGIALILLPVKSAHLYERASFRLSLPVLRMAGGGLIVVSSLFLAIAALAERQIFVLMLCALFCGAAYYYLRKIYLKGRGIDLDATVLSLNFE